MNRQQWTAIALIMMIGVAKAHRESCRMNAELALRNDQSDHDDVVDTADDLKTRMANVKSKLSEVRSGGTYLGYTYCTTTCPSMWISISYNNWKMKSNAQALVKEKFGGEGDINRLGTVDKALAAEFHATMRDTVHTFLKAIDASAFQRIFLTLTMGPLAAFRTLTGLKPLGLCFLKKAWADIEANSKYRQKSTRWWSVMLGGCPAVDANLPESLESQDSTEKLLDGMLYALGKSNGLTDAQDEAEMAAKWAKTDTLTQCVNKTTRSGKSQLRELHIEKGIISWTATSRCESDYFGQFKAYWGHRKSFAMQFLTAKSGEDPVQLYGANILGKQNDQGCISVQNPYRKFNFCAVKDDETMTRAKEVIDQHLEVLKDERELLATNAKLERLIAEASSSNSESKQVLKDMDKTGDSNINDLSRKLGNNQHMTGSTNEEKMAEKILNKIRRGSALVESGENITMGSMLLQECYAEAHFHQHLSAVMEGRATRKFSEYDLEQTNDSVDDGGVTGVVGGTATISTTELLIIIVICGGGLLCVGLVLMLSK